MWWISAAFTALLVVTVVGVGFYFLPAMFTPAPRVPDFEDVDELVKVSRQSIRPEQGTKWSSAAGNKREGSPIPGVHPFLLDDVSGEPSPECMGEMR